jgi:hypothetical protein
MRAKSRWALWNQATGRYYTNGGMIELYDEDEAFATACSWTTTAPFGSGVWVAVRFRSVEDADLEAWMIGLIGVYDASGPNRRQEAWAS